LSASDVATRDPSAAGGVITPKFTPPQCRWRRIAKETIMKSQTVRSPSVAALQTPSDLSEKDTRAIAEALNHIVADCFTLYVKTKNFHWHMSGPHFRDYHLLLDEQGEQIYASIDPLAERVRKLGQRTVRSIGEIGKLARVRDNDADLVDPLEMLDELIADNKSCAVAMRKAHELCDDLKDSGTAGLLETLIDETERRTWFLFEASRGADASGH
jgi:starvation-inducible DNA-binding protein